MPSILGAEEMEYTSRPDVLRELTDRFVSLDAEEKPAKKKCGSKKKKVEVE